MQALCIRVRRYCDLFDPGQGHVGANTIDFYDTGNCVPVRAVSNSVLYVRVVVQ